jgi:hypothetical protein
MKRASFIGGLLAVASLLAVPALAQTPIEAPVFS